MQETAIVRGTIEVLGRADGAVNTLVVPADNPHNWFFKQFVTEEQMREFATQNSYAVRMKQ